MLMERCHSAATTWARISAVRKNKNQASAATPMQATRTPTMSAGDSRDFVRGAASGLFDGTDAAAGWSTGRDAPQLWQMVRAPALWVPQLSHSTEPAGPGLKAPTTRPISRWAPWLRSEPHCEQDLKAAGLRVPQ